MKDLSGDRPNKKRLTIYPEALSGPRCVPMRLTKVDRAWRDAVPINPAHALARYNTLRAVLGAKSATPLYRWDARKDTAASFATVGAANSKMSKAKDLLIGGITTLPARSAADWVRDTEGEFLPFMEEALGMDVARIRAALFATICPHSTAGCRAVCLITEAGRDEPRWAAASPAARWEGSIKRAQLARLILTLADPDAALTLELETMRRTVDTAAAIGRSFRWRVNIADDLARECNPFYASALRDFSEGRFQADRHQKFLGAIAYSYSKRPDRMSSSFHTVCLSATERTTDAEIAERLALGGTVALPLFIARGDEMPSTYRGMPLTDGDKSDDRTADPAGSIVGLRVKGQRAARLGHRGFLRKWEA